jgi:hypothetical protein
MLRPPRSAVGTGAVKPAQAADHDFSGTRGPARGILAIAGRSGARNLGGAGRGGAAGDVDFLVELEAGRSLLSTSGPLMDIQEHLHCKVDVMTPDMLKIRVRERALREALPL